MTQPTNLDWAIRAGIYSFYIDYARVPSADEIAQAFGVESTDACDALHRLHNAHALFLDPGSDRIRMLNPFSGIETPYSVETGGKIYFANCAWDMLGIPAMLGQEALIRARLEDVGSAVDIPVTDGLPRPDRDYVINFSVPFRHWYDNLIHT